MILQNMTTIHSNLQIIVQIFCGGIAESYSAQDLCL